MGTAHTQQGFNQRTDFVKGAASGRSQSLAGIAVGDKILGASRIRLAGTTGAGFLSSIAVLTTAQFTVSAANTIYKKGTPASFPLQLLVVTWLDKDGGSMS
jgi:hypothetical protein